MENLCRRIGMPEEVTRILCDFSFDGDLTPLTREETWETGLEAIQAALGEDPDGLKILWCMLQCARKAKDRYRSLGLPDEIYYDTMAGFSRYVGEYREKYDRWGFNVASWTVRFVSCTLFRIGELEYELVRKNGENWISLHIPTNIILQEPLLRQSYLQARKVIGDTFPAYADAPMYCRSWIMSPILQELLPLQSNIVTFQRSFVVEPSPMDSIDFLEWVTKRPVGPFEELPEETTLQRKLKAYLLSGRAYYYGMGILKPEPFLEDTEGQKDDPAAPPSERRSL